jgi:methylmalonyl-CoA mutase cobalamin-binding subunit
LNKEQAEISAADRAATAIACVPSSAGSDEIIAMMLAQLFRQAGYGARESGAVSPQDCSMEIAEGRYAVVCISSISATGAGQARSLCKRLKAAVPDLKIVAGLWSFESGAAQMRLGAGCTSSVTTALSDAVAQVRELVRPAPARESLAESGQVQ